MANPIWFDWDGYQANAPGDGAATTRKPFGSFDGKLWGLGSDRAAYYIAGRGATPVAGGSYPAGYLISTGRWATPAGLFLLLTPPGASAERDGELWRSADGLTNFSQVATGLALGPNPWPAYALARSLVHIGETSTHANLVLYFEYTTASTTPKVFYSTNGGAAWAELFQVHSTAAIKHFHGGVWLPGVGANEGRLIVMTGDLPAIGGNTLCYCDDIDDLIANPATWTDRWALDDLVASSRIVEIQDAYTLNFDQDDAGALGFGQNFRSTDALHSTGSTRLTWGEDGAIQDAGHQVLACDMDSDISVPANRTYTAVSTVSAPFTSGDGMDGLAVGERVKGSWGTWMATVVSVEVTGGVSPNQTGNIVLGLVRNADNIKDSPGYKDVRRNSGGGDICVLTIAERTYDDFLVGSGWTCHEDADGNVYIVTSSEYTAGAYLKGHDEYVRVYTVLSDGTALELRKWRRNDHADPGSFVAPYWLSQLDGLVWVAFNGALETLGNNVVGGAGWRDDLVLGGQTVSAHPKGQTFPRLRAYDGTLELDTGDTITITGPVALSRVVFQKGSGVGSLSVTFSSGGRTAGGNLAYINASGGQPIIAHGARDIQNCSNVIAEPMRYRRAVRGISRRCWHRSVA